MKNDWVPGLFGQNVFSVLESTILNEKAELSYARAIASKIVAISNRAAVMTPAELADWLPKSYGKLVNSNALSYD